jgi:hypothetical protein
MNFGTENELDGCYHVYLDVGSNVGIQVRCLKKKSPYFLSPGPYTVKLFTAVIYGFL